MSVVAAGCGGTTTTTVSGIGFTVPTVTRTTVAPPQQRTLPPMTNLSVSGGGPSGDPAAAARITAQYPVIPADYQVEGSQAIEYMTRLAQYVPAMSTIVGDLKTANDCLSAYGVVGTKAYLTRDLTQFGAIVVVSQLQAQQLPAIAAKCFVHSVLGGGAGGFNPCFASYRITDTVSGVTDNYYIFTAGTNQEWCDYVRYGHRNFSPQPI
jgi:hypothetical protein